MILTPWIRAPKRGYTSTPTTSWNISAPGNGNNLPDLELGFSVTRHSYLVTRFTRFGHKNLQLDQSLRFYDIALRLDLSSITGSARVQDPKVKVEDLCPQF